MKNKLLVRVILPALFLWVSLIACSENKLSEKQIMALTIPHSGSSQYTPVVKIDQISHRIYINVGQEYELTKLSYLVKVSPGATLVQKPENVSNPVELAVQAEDGSSLIYTLIVSKATGGFATQHTASQIFVRQMRAIYRCTKAFESKENPSSGTTGVSIELDHCDLTGQDNEDYVRLFLRNKTLASNLIGTYSLVPNGTASCQFSYKKDLGSWASKFSPFEGTLVITGYDRLNQVISGRFENIGFKDLGEEYPRQVISGAFFNIPVQ